MKVAIIVKVEELSYTEAEALLRSRLEEVPLIRIQLIVPGNAEDCRLDIRVDLLIGERPITVFADIEKDGTPRAAREAAARMSDCLARVPLKAYGVIIAPFISGDAGAILGEQGVGYADLAGNYRFCFEQVYVYVRSGEKPATVKQTLRSIYSPKSTRILRMLLCQPGKAWKVQEMAERAEISLGQAWKVKDQLCAREWLREQDKGFVLVKPEVLLKDWAQNYKPAKREAVHDYYSFQKPDEVEYGIAEECGKRNISYALAEFSGGARYAPVVRYSRASAYVSGNIDELAEALELKKVPSGANVRLVLAKDNGVFSDARMIGGVNVVSPVQAYLDLLKISGRGEEAADGILKEEIEPKWR